LITQFYALLILTFLLLIFTFRPEHNVLPAFAIECFLPIKPKGKHKVFG